MRKANCLGCVIALLLLVSCGGSDRPCPLQPDLPGHDFALERARSAESGSNRHLLGLWRVRIGSNHQSAEVLPLRAAEMHLNAVRLLEVEPCADCLKISNVALYPDYELTADLTLKHPFPGYLKLTGFDVRGVFISGADYTFPASGRSIAWGEGLPRVLNADGYTALFNPTEFPDATPPAFGYIEGKYAFGGDLSATLNPFLAYCEDTPRRMFEAGSIRTRTVRVRLPDDPLEFGYAVDACWVKVDGEVTDPVEDFPPEANCLEAYRIDVEIGAGLGPYAGSSVPVEVTVHDHQGFDTILSASMEAPDLFEGEVALDFSAVTGEESYLFAGTLTNELAAGEGDYPLLVRVIDTYEDPNLGTVDAWQVGTVSVGHKKGWALTWGGIQDDYGMGAAIDVSGNIYVAGYFAETVDFDPGPAVDEHSSKGCHDIVLSKFDSSGAFQWARTWGGMYPDCSMEVAADDLGNTCVTGAFRETVDFDPGPGIDEHVSKGSADVFLSRFASNGDFLWARTWGESYAADYGCGVTPGAVCDAYVVGYFYGTCDFDPGLGTEEHTSTGSYDAFLSKLPPDGNW